MPTSPLQILAFARQVLALARQIDGAGLRDSRAAHGDTPAGSHRTSVAPREPTRSARRSPAHSPGDRASYRCPADRPRRSCGARHRPTPRSWSPPRPAAAEVYEGASSSRSATTVRSPAPVGKQATDQLGHGRRQPGSRRRRSCLQIRDQRLVHDAIPRQGPREIARTDREPRGRSTELRRSAEVADVLAPSAPTPHEGDALQPGRSPNPART